MNAREINRSETWTAVLGAGPEQLHSILTAQRLGAKVLAFDRDGDAPGLRQADVGMPIDPMQIDQVVAACRARAVRCLLPVPVGALLEVVGEVNGRLRLPGIASASARYCSDKYIMRRRLTACGLFQPLYRESLAPSELPGHADALGWPVIIKPRRGSGSRGVVVLRNPQEMALHQAWHHEQASRSSDRPSTLVEQWLDGPEFGLDCAVVNGRFQLLCIRRKEVTPLPFRLAFGVSTPPELEPGDIDRLSQAAQQACTALELDDCLVHVDALLHDRGAIIIELSGRPSGFHISSRFLPAVIGLDPIAEMVRHLLGLKADFRPRSARAGIMQMLRIPAGRFVKAEGIDVARRLPSVVALECTRNPGDLIGRADSGGNVLPNGYIITAGDTLAAARSSCDAALAQIHYHISSDELRLCG